MNYCVLPVKVPGSAPYASFTLYLQEPSASLRIKTRPVIVICPGGGYERTSDREAEPLALAFLSMGYHAAVLRYSTAPDAVFPTALQELATVVKLLHEHEEEWKIAPGKILVCGASAGGHLAASLGVFWNRDLITRSLGLKPEERALIRPDALLLLYPVITSGPYTHEGSMRGLLGESADDPYLRKLVSLENQVSADTPPTFLWHAGEDQTVPAENSLLFAMALRRAQVPVELHLYQSGGHGLSLADYRSDNPDGGRCCDACTSWVDLANRWIENLWEEPWYV